MKIKRSGTLLLHLAYWALLVGFFTMVWGTYDQTYQRNFFIQLYSLPARLLLTYATLLVLIPKLFLNGKYVAFFWSFTALLLFCSVVVQRSIIIYLVEGRYFDYHSEAYFVLHHLVNTTIDVLLGAVLPIAYTFVTLWNKNRKVLERLRGEQKSIEKKPVAKETLKIKTGRVFHSLALEDIVLLESQRNYVVIQTKEKSLKHYGSLSALVAQLPDNFVRVQRSFVLNLHHLESYTSTSITAQGKAVPIGRKYKKEVLESIESTI